MTHLCHPTNSKNVNAPRYFSLEVFEVHRSISRQKGGRGRLVMDDRDTTTFFLVPAYTSVR